MSWRWLRYAAIGTAILVIGFLLLVGYVIVDRRYTYPYGWSHSCLTGLGLELENYASEHDGHFPAGEACPEASLSLLDQGHNGDYAEMLCGKTKSPKVAKAILQRGELLGPDTCDWHYVEGLTLADDPRIAIVWDKIGLGHNGERLSNGGHFVWFLELGQKVVSESEWPQFLKDQEQLLAARTETVKRGLPALAAKVRLPTGELVDHYDAPYELDETSSGSSRGSSHSSGRVLKPSVLQWWKFYSAGTVAMELRFNGWTSQPVKVQISQGVATPNSVVFDMR
jgi:hypothetical protein